jgi:hypothetical protein
LKIDFGYKDFAPMVLPERRRDFLLRKIVFHAPKMHAFLMMDNPKPVPPISQSGAGVNRRQTC